MERLYHKKAWVVFRFQDGTRITINTTLSHALLQKEGIMPRKGFLWDFNRNRYMKFRRDAVSVDVFDNRPVYDEEVLQFASRFI